MSALEYLNGAPDPKGYEIVSGALWTSLDQRDVGGP